MSNTATTACQHAFACTRRSRSTAWTDKNDSELPNRPCDRVTNPRGRYIKVRRERGVGKNYFCTRPALINTAFPGPLASLLYHRPHDAAGFHRAPGIADCAGVAAAHGACRCVVFQGAGC